MLYVPEVAYLFAASTIHASVRVVGLGFSQPSAVRAGNSSVIKACKGQFTASTLAMRESQLEGIIGA